MNKSKGIKLALVTALISGVSIFVNKFAVGSVTPPLTFTATKNFLVGFMIIGVLLVSGKWRELLKAKKDVRWKLLLISIVGGSLPFYLFFTGLSMTPAVNAALIHKTLVLWVAVLASLFLGEKLSKLQGMGILVLFSSNLLVGGFKGLLFSTGELMVLAATLLWAVENVIAKKVLIETDPDVVTAARMAGGSLFLVGASLLTAPQSARQILALSGNQWFWLLLTALFLVGYVSSWYRALKFAPVILVSSVLVISTLVTNLLSAIFITNTFNPVIIPQVILILLGLGLYLVSVRGIEFKTSLVQ